MRQLSFNDRLAPRRTAAGKRVARLLGVAAGPEMMSGVRDSSMRIESTSSTMAKFRTRWTRRSNENFMLSRR